MSDTTTIATQRTPSIAEHIAAECTNDLDRALATFHSAHYHVYPLGVDAPGDEAVRGLLSAVFTVFPDFPFVAERSYHAADAVIVEGASRARKMENGRACSADRTSRRRSDLLHIPLRRGALTSEAVYFDHATLLSQIGQ